MPKLRKDEIIWIYSMGKRFALTGVFATDAEANAHCERHNDDGVIACAAGFVFVACIYAGVKPEREDD